MGSHAESHLNNIFSLFQPKHVRICEHCLKITRAPQAYQECCQDKDNAFNWCARIYNYSHSHGRKWKQKWKPALLKNPGTQECALRTPRIVQEYPWAFESCCYNCHFIISTWKISKSDNDSLWLFSWNPKYFAFCFVLFWHTPKVGMISITIVINYSN